MSLYDAVAQLFQLIWLVMILRILLTWFPNIDWWKQPFKFLNDVTEPIFAPFRGLIPPIGGLDLSPIVPFLCFEVIRVIILGILI